MSDVSEVASALRSGCKTVSQASLARVGMERSPALPRHPRVVGFACGAVLGSTYAVPELALGGAGWEREPWAQALWMHPKVPGSKKTTTHEDDFCVATPYEHENGTRFVHFPRAVGLALFGPPAQDARSEGEPIDEHVEFTGTLMTTPVPQVAAVNAICLALTKSKTRMGCAVMRCGFGKTVCAVAVIARLRRKTAILVHTKQLAEQWRDRINFFAPNACVYVHGDDAIALSERADVSIVIVQTAMRQQSLRDIGLVPQRFGLVVVDETHHIAARMFSRALRHFPAASVLGLTATPKRSDGLEKLVYWLVGYPCFTALESEHREHTVATLARIQLPTHAIASWPAYLRASKGAEAFAAAERIGDGMVARLLSVLGNNESYARAVAVDILRKHTNAQRHLLIMSTRRNQLMNMARWMRSEAARQGYIAWVGRGLLCKRRPVNQRANLVLHVDERASLVPPLQDAATLVRTFEARVAAPGVRENLRRFQELHVHVMSVHHAISGDICLAIVPEADNLLVAIRDWDSVAIVTQQTTTHAEKRPRSETTNNNKKDDDDDDDDDEDDEQRITGAGQRLAHHMYVQYPPTLRTETNTLTHREVMHGACGLHRNSENDMNARLYAHKVLRIKRKLPLNVTEHILSLSHPVMKIGFCVGGMPSERWKPLLDCNILLSTSQQCAEGFDDPKRDTLIMTLPPRGNLKQLFGRVQRPCPVKCSPTKLVLYHAEESDPVFHHKVAQWGNAVRRDGFERTEDDVIDLRTQR